MRCLYSTEKNQFWYDFILELQHQYDFEPIYWIGGEKKNGDSSVQTPENCHFYDAWKAFSLSDTAEPSTKQDSLSMDSFSRLEYYNYLKILDRVDFRGNFSFSERDALFKRQIEHWNNILKTFCIECVIFSNAPHLPYDYPLYLVAKKRGCLVYIFNSCAILGRYYLSKELGGMPLEPSKPSSEITEESIEQDLIRNFRLKTFDKPWYMKEQARRNKKLNSFLESRPYTFYFARKVYRFFTRKNAIASHERVDKISSFKAYKGLYNVRSISLRQLEILLVEAQKDIKLLHHEYNKYCQTPDLREIDKFIYFPLHYQPELTTTPLGGDASDQLYTIREISKALPEGVVLLVKEHPSQFTSSLYGYQGRGFGYWKQIASLPNVILCSLTVPSEQLLKACSAVVTVTGTIGWEAIVNQKPCICFGMAWYQMFPQVIQARFDNLYEAIDKALSGDAPEPITHALIYDLFIKKSIQNNIHTLNNIVNKPNAKAAAEFFYSVYKNNQ